MNDRVRSWCSLALVCAGIAAAGVARAGGGGDGGGKKAAPPPPTAGDRAEDAAEMMTLADVLKVAIRQAPALANAAIDTRTSAALARRATGPEDTIVSGTGEWIKNSFGGDTRTAELAITRLLP